ncbi:hypothetical protein ACFOG5_19930 [Pedobacter fastidiosus]|uniref:hypothetical protein n=1 Tax=Pedobacter fastidiosus TaxID=2765361 RepID=UPI00164E6FCD|nr:hypothetical protein [Pedobacter fastidiosus]
MVANVEKKVEGRKVEGKRLKRKAERLKRKEEKAKTKILTERKKIFAHGYFSLTLKILKS